MGIGEVLVWIVLGMVAGALAKFIMSRKILQQEPTICATCQTALLGRGQRRARFSEGTYDVAA